ncbi:MAG: alpha/beta fold hydrolase [Actinomycetota bacterium]|nr:alpha/beta fold hydrolase [Actinomycetota bacterium]
MSRPATSRDEVGFFARAGEEDIFGILTRPTIEPNGKAVIMCQGGAWIPSPGRNRFFVRLARQFARHGYHAVRFDYHGVGDSSGEIGPLRLDSPFSDDVMAMAKWVEEEHGISDFVLMGTCFGSRTALAAATRLEQVSGVALFPVPVRDMASREKVVSYPLSWYLRRALTRRALTRMLEGRFRRRYLKLLRRKSGFVAVNARKRAKGEAHTVYQKVSPVFLGHLGQVIDRHVPLLLVFGREDMFYEDFRRGSKGPLAQLLQRAGDRLRLHLVDGHAHGLAQLDLQDQVFEALEAWLIELDRGVKTISTVVEPAAS